MKQPNKPRKSSTKNVLYASGVAALLLIGGYAVYDSMTGNHIEIEQVIPAAQTGGTAAAGQNASANTNTNANANGNGQAASSGDAPQTIAADKLNGTWKVETASSKMYLSVTTSRETVNIEGADVQGEWTLNIDDPSQTKGKGEVGIASLQSGNNQRDSHVKSSDYLQADVHPKATFTLASVEGLPEEWKQGEVIPLKLNGTLQVKGIDKTVVFDGSALYDNGKLKLSASAVVTFADFGMKNPHAVVLAAENDLTVRLELVFAK